MTQTQIWFKKLSLTTKPRLTFYNSLFSQQSSPQGITVATTCSDVTQPMSTFRPLSVSMATVWRVWRYSTERKIGIVFHVFAVFFFNYFFIPWTFIFIIRFEYCVFSSPPLLVCEQYEKIFAFLETSDVCCQYSNTWKNCCIKKNIYILSM